MNASGPRCVSACPSSVSTIAPGPAARRLRLTAILLALSCVLLAISAVHASAATREFGTPRFQTNDTGDITYVSNTLSTCADDSVSSQATGSLGCADGRAGRNALYNNLVPNQRINVANIGTGNTANSSTSNFTLPANAQVLWAGLYWGADPGSSGVNDVTNPAQTIQLRTPGTATFRTITATQFDSGAPAPHENSYQGFANVTDIVRAAGGGAYTAGGIPLFAPSNPGATNGQPTDSYGGWSLVIVTKDPAQPARNLSVFDGFVGVTQSPKVEPTINVSGFLTPRTGPVNTKLGIIAYEGDRGITGDYAQLNGQNLSDAANPATNFFNSTQTTLGARRTGMTPDYDNAFGYDADIFDATGRIPNGATSASIKLGTTQDVYAPGVVTLATELFAPKFTPSKSFAYVDANHTGPTVSGDLLEYTVSYRNTGGDDAADVRIDDALPPNTTFVNGSLRITDPGADQTPTDAAGDDAGEYDAANRVVRFRPGTGGGATSGGTVGVGETATVTFRVRVDNGLADNTRIDNVATAGYRAATTGTSFTDLPTPVASTVVRAPDLQIAKTITTAPVGAGDNEKFSLQVTNTGGAPTSGLVTVRDEVPAAAFPNVRGASGSGWDCTVVGQIVTCTRSGALAAGAGYPPIVVDVTAAGTLPAVIQNDTTVAGGGDSNLTNNTGTATAAGTNRADLNVTKRFGQARAIVGGVVTWTIDARNDGPSTATNVVVADDVPDGLNVTNVTSTRGTCTTGPGASGQDISCALGSVAANSGASITVTATVTGAPGTISNTATATSTTVGNVTAVTDPNPQNNTSTATLTVDPSADVTITKAGPATAPNAGAPYAFTLTVGNSGPDAAQNVSVTDGIPANFVVTGVTAPQGVDCSRTAERVLCTIASLASGQTRDIVITGTSANGGLVTNTATADSTTADPNANNNSATAVARVGTLADVSLVKTFGATNPVVAGNSTTVTLTASNAGPSTAANVTAVDTLPTGLTFTGGANCAAQGQVVTCQMGDIASGADVARTFDVQVAGTARGNVTNTARAESATTTDPFPGNNSSSAQLALAADADLQITNVATPGSVDPGATVQWTVTARNNGPTQAVNPRFTVRVPDGVTGAAIVSTSGGGTCTGPVNQVITCTRGTLDSTAEFAVVFSGTISQSVAGTSLTDPASVTSDTGDTNTGNNQATATVAVNRRYRITLAKTTTATTVAPNQAVTFTLRATNAGPNDAPNVSLVDTLPAGTVFVSADAGCTPDGGVVTCAIGDLANGESKTRTVTLRTTNANAGTTISNSVAYTTPDPTTVDVNRGTPAGTASATVPVSPAADLSVTNVASVETAKVGDPVTWNVTGTNTGPSSADGATLEVTFPAGVVGLQVSQSPGSTCTITGQTVRCVAQNPLASGGTLPVTITSTIDRSAANSTQTATAEVRSTTPDPALGNNRATDAVVVGRSYELSITKTARQNTVAPGGTAIFDLSITNAGPNQATGVNLVDTLPTGTTVASAPGCSAPTMTTLTCPIGTLANGETQTRVVTLNVPSTLAGQPLTNRLAYNTPDPVDVDVNQNTPAKSQASATVTVGPDADLQITNTVTPGTAVVGDRPVWTVTGRNAGPSTASGVRFVVTVPATVTNPVLTSGNADCGAFDATARTFTCTRASLPSGGTVPMSFTGTVARDAAGTTITVPASITSSTPEINTGNNSASSDLAVARRYELSVRKTAVDPTVQPGQTAAFDLTATNAGPNPATTITLVDTLPADTTFVSASNADCTPGAGNTVRCAVGTIAPNTTVTRRVTIQTTSGNSGDTLRNVLTYSTPDGVAIDVNKNNADTNTSTATVAVAARADLAVTITPNPASTVVGGPVTWTVVGRNLGPDDAVNATFTAILPDGVTFTGSTGTGCSVSGKTLTCNRDTLASGDSFTGTISGTIDRSAAGSTVEVPARITSATTDDNQDNNRAVGPVAVGRRYELQVEKTADQPRVGPNQDLKYTLKITNNGPNGATGVNLVDPLPANTTLVSATQGCTVQGTTVTCPVGDLANGASATREITVRTGTAAAGTTVTNSATYTTPDGPAVDVNRGTPAATGTATVQVTPLVDLGITKSVTPGRVTAGGEVVYTLDVVNNGPNGATGVVVDDALPEGLTVLQTAPTQGSCSVSGRAVRCALGDVAAGGRAQVIIRARADSAGTVNNTATVTSDQAESDPSNNTSGQVPLVIDPVPAPPANPPATPAPTPAPASLDLSKVLISKTVTVGRVLTYRITVTNKGGSVARGVRITDVPSRTLDVLGVKPTVGSCPGRSPITCNLGDLAPGQTAQVTVSVRANAPGKLSNAATAVATGSPEVPAKTDVADTSVRRLASSVSVKKTASARTVRGGSTVKFSIRVKNFTKKTVRKVLVCDTLPRGLVFQKASPLKVTGRKACVTIGSLKAGEIRTFVVTVRAESRKTAKTLTNAARAVVPNELSSKASRAIRVTPGPGVSGNGGVTG